MATFTGQSGTVRDGSDTVGEVKEFEINQTGDVVETTAMGDTWKTFTATQRSWAASVTCHYDPGDTNGQVVFAVGSTIAFEGYPSGNTSGHGDLSGAAIVTSRVIRSVMTDVVEISLELQGNSTLTETTVA